MRELAAYAVEKFTSRSARVGILGLGYAGLPLACTFAEAGFTTLGFDIDGCKIKELKHGHSYIGHISSKRLSAVIDGGTLRPTEEFGELIDCDAAIICVPTPLGEGRTPDLSHVVDTATVIAQYLHPAELVVLESTTYPGTTEEVLLPILRSSGLTVGKDFFLAFSPEREDPANPAFNTHTIPKVVGGMTETCGMVACSAYGAIVEQVVPFHQPRLPKLQNSSKTFTAASISQ
jgi:nucleotide sugar dehydrogenase